MPCGCCTAYLQKSQRLHRVTNPSSSQKHLEGTAIEGDSPVDERGTGSGYVREYHGTREILWEAGGTTLQG